MIRNIAPRLTARRLSSVVALVMVCAWPSAYADYTVTLDPSENRGTWEGFGAGLSWWAHAVGGTPYESTYTDLFFGMAPVSFKGAMVPGLGMNLVRYNVGGGGLPTDNIGGATDQRPSVQPWYKDIDGYWRDWYSTDPASASYDWTRDARQRGVLSRLRSRGVTVEFVSHAPMWWMMDSRSSAGGNLQAWNRRDHARHLANVAQQARTRWGVDVKSIEPFNEPLAGWWNYPVVQEGANIPVAAQAEVIGYLREELDARGLTDLVIAGSDENTMSQALSGYLQLASTQVSVRGQTTSAAALLGKVNVHGYNGLEPWRDDSVRRRLRAAVGDKRLWMTEYGDGEGSGLTLAQSILADLSHLRPTAWFYWQPAEPYSAWGLVNGQYAEAADETSPTRGQPTWMYTKYHVFAQFSRFLRPGYKLIGNSDGRSVAAYDSANRKLVLITLNEGPKQTIVYDLSRLGAVTATAATVVTTTLDGSSLLAGSTATLAGKRLKLRVPANSVQSIEIAGVELGRLAEEIRSAATGQCVDVLNASTLAASPLVQYDCAGVDHQRWSAVPSGDAYTFKIGATGQCMNVNGASLSPGAALIQWPCSGTANEQFDLRPQGLGYAFVARHSGLCVGLENGSTARDTRLTQQACTGAASQTWLIPLGASTLQSTGHYLCLDMPGGTLQQGAEAAQWPCVGSTNQLWNIKTAKSGYSTLQSVRSGQCLEVLFANTDPGAPVGQRTCNRGQEQQFLKRAQGVGFALASRLSGLCLAAENDSAVWGARIVQQRCSGSANQTWR